MSSQGRVHGLKDGIDVKRLQVAYPLYKIAVDIYLPKSLNGSLLQGKTSDILYEDEPSYRDFECVITNLEHYEKSDVIFESFVEDKTLMKILQKSSSNLDLPVGSKIVVLDRVGNSYKTYVIDDKPSITSVLGKIVAHQYELVPSHLMDSDSLLNSAKKIKEKIDNGSLISDDIVPEKMDAIEIKKFNEDEVLVISEEGSLYYE